MEVLTQGKYFGSQRKELDQKGIGLSEYDYVDSGTPWHYHENPYFMYVINGQMLDINKNKESYLGSGSLMFLNWQDPHATSKHSKTGRGFHLQIEKNWLVQHDLDANLWEGSKKLEHPAIHNILGKIYFEFCRTDSFSALSIELLVMELCQMLTINNKNEKNNPTWVVKLKDILHQEDEDSLSLDGLSKELGVHPVHISRSFPAYLNTTLGEYVRSQKIKKAFPLIMDLNKSLGHIAVECGFSDQSHFIRTFKSYYGLTPKSYRKQMAR